MEYKKWLIFFGILSLVSGCASSPATAPAAPRVPLPSSVIQSNENASSVERLVFYAERIRWFAPSTLEAERVVAERDHLRTPNSFNRIRLALLLSLHRAPFRDDARARDLLSQAAKESNTENRPTRSFAMLLLQELDDRWLGERALDEERRQRQILQKKLDQLKAIEEEMDRRPPPPIVTPPR